MMTFRCSALSWLLLAATTLELARGFTVHKTQGRRPSAVRYGHEDPPSPSDGSIEGGNGGGSSSSSSANHNNSNRHQEEHKNSHRARIERSLEESMDNDWRLFRAKLIAQEKMYCIEHKEPSTRRKDEAKRIEDDLLNQYEDMKNVNGAGTESLLAGDRIGRQPPPQRHSRQQGYEYPHSYDKRYGRHHQQQQQQHQFYHNENMEILYNDDPFVSEAELPLLIPKTNINKHRWAHEIPHLEAGCVLIANERLGGIFHQTVVLIVQHCENEGTFGVVINRPLEGGLMKVASGPTNVDLSLKMAFQKSPVTYGGPVMSEDFSVLHSFGEVAGARKICPGVYIGGSDELMNQVRCGTMDPKRALFVKGHSAWEAGQLWNEIRHGVWYMAAVSSDLCLRYAGVELEPEDNPNDLWSDILQCMGGRYEDVARRYGGTGDARRAMP